MSVFVPFFSFSQDQAKPREATSFYSVASFGMVAGQSGAKPAYQLLGGIKYRRYSGGLGVGFDEYRYRSVPLFADMRINFTKNQLAFVYTDAGYNFPYHLKSEENNFTTTDDYKGGLYLDLGIGYNIRLGKLNSLLFSSGYSYKEIRNTVGYTYPCLVPPCNEDIYRYNYYLGRIMAKLSWQLGR